MRLSITLFLLLAAASRSAAEAPPLGGTMPEDYVPALRSLLKEAVEKSPSAIMADIAVAQAHAATYSYSSALWPSLYASVDYAVTTQSESSSSSSTSKGLYYSVGVNQPIFQWGAYKNNATIGHLAELVSERNFDEAYRTVAISIREQFVALVQKKILLRNSQFNLKLSNENLAAQQSRFDSGASSQAELSNSKLVVDQAQLDADRGQEDYNYSKQLLIRLAGVETLDDNLIPLELPHPKFDPASADAVLTGFVGGGVESTFQSEVYKLYAKQSDLNYKIAKVRLLPKLAANGNFSYSNYSEPFGNGVQQVGLFSESYNVTASWQIFDGFSTTGAKKSALASKRSYERQLKTYVDSSIDLITNMRRVLGLSYRSMGLTEVHTALLDAGVTRLNQDLALGYASQATIDAGLLTLYATQFQQVLARSDFYNRWTEFVSLAGIDPALANLPSNHGR